MKKLHITEDDAELFLWLWMLRVLSLDQIRRLRYFQPATGALSSPDNVRKRMARLAKAGYLVGDRVQLTRERIYFLGEASLPVLRDMSGVDQQRLYAVKEESALQVLHPLLVSECAIRFVQGLRSAVGTGSEPVSPIQLVDLEPFGMPFYTTHTVEDSGKRKHVERYVTQEDVRVPGFAAPMRVRPDLLFGLRGGEQSRLFFVEADRGSESAQMIAEKMLAYHHYADFVDRDQPNRLRWRRYAENAADFRVLLVTTNEMRIKKLQRAVNAGRGGELLAMTTESELRQQDVLREAVWWVQGEKRALVG